MCKHTQYMPSREICFGSKWCKSTKFLANELKPAYCAIMDTPNFEEKFVPANEFDFFQEPPPELHKVQRRIRYLRGLTVLPVTANKPTPFFIENDGQAPFELTDLSKDHFVSKPTWKSKQQTGGDCGRVRCGTIPYLKHPEEFWSKLAEAETLFDHQIVNPVAQVPKIQIFEPSPQQKPKSTSRTLKRLRRLVPRTTSPIWTSTPLVQSDDVDSKVQSDIVSMFLTPINPFDLSTSIWSVRQSFHLTPESDQSSEYSTPTGDQWTTWKQIFEEHQTQMLSSVENKLCN